MHQRPNTIEQVDDDEIKLIEVHKHPIGLVIVYTQTAVGILTAITLLFFVIPTVVQDESAAFWVAASLGLFAFLFAGLVLAISTYIFKQNRIIVTDRNITQILQFGLFSRKVSQLNIVNVEDVTSEQRGILQTSLNYGVLKIETAGEQANFVYDFCPNSGNVAKIILDAREKMLGQSSDSSVSSGSAGISPEFKLTGAKGHKRPPVPTDEDGNETSGASSTSGSSSNNSKSKDNKKKNQINVRGIGAEIVEHALDNRSN